MNEQSETFGTQDTGLRQKRKHRKLNRSATWTQPENG